MYDAVAGNGFWACLYFVADFVLLNTVVLNLIISVLIDNCATANSVRVSARRMDSCDLNALHKHTHDQRAFACVVDHRSGC